MITKYLFMQFIGQAYPVKRQQAIQIHLILQIVNKINRQAIIVAQRSLNPLFMRLFWDCCILLQFIYMEVQ